ncbi:tail fiber domain-containing protein [Nakamurella sp. GG22]
MRRRAPGLHSRVVPATCRHTGAAPRPHSIDRGNAAMPSDIRLNENTIDLADAEVQNTGPLAGYAFRDRTKPGEQRWVLYSHAGNARLFADSRGEDVATFSKEGLVSTGGPEAGFQFFNRQGPAKGNAIWYCDNDGAWLEFTGPLSNGKVTERLAIGVKNSTGVTIFTHARVTGGFNAQGQSHFNDNLSVDGSLDVHGNVKVGGTISQASSATLKDDVTELSGEQAMDALRDLNPVTFRYKADSSRHRNVGFIAEDAPELVSHQQRDRLSPMDIVAVLTKVVKEQQALIDGLTDQVGSITRHSETTT